MLSSRLDILPSREVVSFSYHDPQQTDCATSRTSSPEDNRILRQLRTSGSVLSVQTIFLTMSAESNNGGAPPSSVTDAVLVPSNEMPVGAQKVEGLDFNKFAGREVTAVDLLNGMSNMGFQASLIGEAVRIINNMVSDCANNTTGLKSFLSFKLLACNETTTDVSFSEHGVTRQIPPSRPPSSSAIPAISFPLVYAKQFATWPNIPTSAPSSQQLEESKKISSNVSATHTWVHFPLLVPSSAPKASTASAISSSQTITTASSKTGSFLSWTRCLKSKKSPRVKETRRKWSGPPVKLSIDWERRLTMRDRCTTGAIRTTFLFSVQHSRMVH